MIRLRKDWLLMGCVRVFEDDSIILANDVNNIRISLSVSFRESVCKILLVLVSSSIMSHDILADCSVIPVSYIYDMHIYTYMHTCTYVCMYVHMHILYIWYSIVICD